MNVYSPIKLNNISLFAKLLTSPPSIVVYWDTVLKLCIRKIGFGARYQEKMSPNLQE